MMGSAPRFFTLSALRSRERSEEHTSELQSQSNLVCRLLLEKKKITYESRAEKHNTKLKPPSTLICTRPMPVNKIIPPRVKPIPTRISTNGIRLHDPAEARAI